MVTARPARPISLVTDIYACVLFLVLYLSPDNVTGLPGQAKSAGSTTTHAMLNEFKAFIMKGNVLELAVAVIIAGAFGAIVTSMTNDILMPPIGMALGGVDFSELAIQLSPDTVAEDGSIVEGAAIRYGNFIQQVINFLIIAFCVFLIVRSYNKLTAPKVVEAPAPPPGPTELEVLLEIRDSLRRP